LTLSRFGETLSTVLAMTSSPFVRMLAAGALAAALGTAANDVAAQAKPGPVLPPPPLSVQVIAPSPDPPWTLRIDNEGDRPVRIPADIRLLSFEIQRPGKGSTWEPCKPAPGQKPSSFPTARALYLQPGESWVESFDPRLFCFGLQGDRLRGGTLVRPRFGFSKQGWAPNREPFAAQSIDAPVSFASVRELAAPTFLLSYAPAELAPIEPAPLHATHANEPLGKAPPPQPPPSHEARGWVEDHEGRHWRPGDAGHRHDRGHDRGDAEPQPAATDAPRSEGDGKPGERGPDGKRKKRTQRNVHDESVALEKQRAKEREAEREKELRETYVDETIGVARRDRQAPDLDLYVHGWSDGSAPRDLTLRIHAKNEGGRKLAAVLRTRMLRFRVEGPLTPQNQTPATVECIVDERSHGVPVEMVRDFRPGERLDVPFLLAEICPHGTFDRPGLFRVTPLLVSQIEGEAVQHRDAFQGRVRALQPALARVGTSRLPFYDGPPRTTKTSGIGRDPDEVAPEPRPADPMPAAPADDRAPAKPAP
jgi:hypothetical protein